MKKFGTSECSMDRIFGDHRSISRASDGGVESPGLAVKVGSRRPMSGTPSVKKSCDSRKGSDLPQPSTVSFSDDAFSIVRFTVDMKTCGGVAGGGHGIPDPRTGVQDGDIWTR